MKILFTRFPLESALGGAELQTLSLMEGLIARGHAVAFAGSCPVLLKECRKRGIPTVSWNIGDPPVTKLGTLTFFWRRFVMRRSLRTLLHQFEELDCVCMLSLSEKLLMTDLAHDRDVAVLWIEHDRIGCWLTKNPWLALLRRQSHVATTVTVSDLSRRMYVDLGWNPARVIAIPNGIDLARFKKQKTKNKNPDPRLRLLCIARLSPEKGIDLLIKAIHNLPDVTLTILGKGKEQRSLQRMITGMHLQDRINIIEKADDISDLFQTHDALILPSKDHDPFGMAAAEAMLFALPVIVTDTCGIAGYLHDGVDALIVKANSVSALQEAISMLRNPEIRKEIGAKGKTTASQAFDLQRMIDRYEEVMKNT